MSKTRSRFKPDSEPEVEVVETEVETEVEPLQQFEDQMVGAAEETSEPEPEPTPEPEPVPVVPDEAQLVRFIQVDVDKRLVLCVEPGHARDGWLMRVRGDEVVVPVILCHGLSFFADLVE